MPETRPEPQSQSDQSALLGWINKAFVIIDDVILLLVAIGIIAVAILLLIEAATDFIDFSKHSISHIVSDLMFVLIIMELFRQVLRQINRHTFSLNPFIYIGVIASIRGILLTQMKLGLGEAEWQSGVLQLLVHAAIVLVLVISLSVYLKRQKQQE
ncbi:MAG: phosphate-starvation-inducible PsiE family protein [Deltaproteobacteria bacterium]|mgnify:CR=1 FL=1|jgi:uncharacterized membrane protein (DUF373 family)